MRYIQNVFTIIMFTNSCFGLINFDNEQEIETVKSRITQVYQTKNINNPIETLKEWQNKIQSHRLNLSNSNLQDDDLSLLRILFEYNPIISIDLSGNKLTHFDGFAGNPNIRVIFPNKEL